MRIFNRCTLRGFRNKPKYRDTKESLAAWFAETTNAPWKNTPDIKAAYRSVDVVNGIAVFNIHGYKYRLIVGINFEYQSVYVHFVAMHKEYDKFQF